MLLLFGFIVGAVYAFLFLCSFVVVVGGCGGGSAVVVVVVVVGGGGGGGGVISVVRFVIAVLDASATSLSLYF